MNKPNIAIIYTTFLRDSLAIGTLRSILSNWNNNYLLLIGDQNNKKMDLTGCSTDKIIYYKLPYDCGLSYARNFLIKKAAEMNIPYILMTADSIAFTQLYDFQPIINFLESDKSIAKIGFKLDNRICWEFNLDLVPTKYFYLTSSNEYSGIYKKVDICKNFFLGKTESFINIPYDNDLKLFEHEDHCWRLKQAGYKTYYINSISANYIKNEPSLEYKTMRSRMYREFKQILLKKYNLVSWVKYSPEVLTEIETWKKKNNCL
jgi:GT2 family glycosyltransferase